jgi:predicted Co/Zn/Cd cation transporter (cation efflux family)
LPGERKKKKIEIKNIKKREEKKEVIEEWSKVLDKIGDEVEKYGIERDKNINFGDEAMVERIE